MHANHHAIHAAFALLTLALHHGVQGQSLGAPTVESASLGILVEGRSSVNASINCHTTVTGSSDEFVLQWFRNNESVTAQQEEFLPTGAAVRFFSNNLNLNDGDGVWLENDSATYTCILMDKTADLKSAPTVFRLVVNVPAEVLNISATSAILGQDLTLTCNTRGTSPLNYTWTLPNGTLYHRQTLTVASVQSTDGGRYSCKVQNGFGLQIEPIDIPVLERPNLGDSYAPQVIGNQQRQLKVTWNTSVFSTGNTPITRYFVRCTSTLTPGKVYPPDRNPLPPSQSAEVIKDLHPGRQYSCVLTVENKVGATDSQPGRATVIEEPPGQAPVLTSVTSLSSTSIQLKWKQIPTDQLNGILLGFIISAQAPECLAARGSCPCTRTECGLSQNISISAAGMPVSRTLVGLRRFTMFSVTMAAYNGAGTGDYSTPSTVWTNPDTPGAPENLTVEAERGTSSMLVRFAPPSEPNGIVTGFSLTYLGEAQTSESQPIIITADGKRTLEARIPRLPRKVSYVFYVRAVNSVGAGQPASKEATVPAYPVITHLSGSTVVPEYAAEVALRCSADGDPPPSIRWTRQGNKTERQARPDGSLVLSAVQSSDAGTYVCTATNVWGTDSNSTALSVLSKSSSIISGFKDSYLYVCIAAAVLILLLLVLVFLLRHRCHSSGKLAVKARRPTAGQHGGNDEFGVPGLSLYNVDNRYSGAFSSSHLNQTATFQRNQESRYQTQEVQQHRGSVISNEYAMPGSHADPPEASSLPAGSPSSFYPGGKRQATQPMHVNFTESGRPLGAYPPVDEQAEHIAVNPVTQQVNTDFQTQNMMSSHEELLVTEQLPTYTARLGDHILTAM
eukprot:scpid32389/ scgid13831/ Down syndrome cell adhesion molecule-like protein 1; Down syndrome cell adhesion molecule 2